MAVNNVGSSGPMDISPFQRYSLEPKSSVTGSGLLNQFGGMLKSFMGGVGGVPGAAMSELSPIFSQTLEEQKYWQFQMQLISLLSNVEKSKHECQMVPLRNVSVR